jgi:hypothetical protein
MRASCAQERREATSAACNRGLGHPTLTQQHHLDALALRRWYLPTKRSSQPPHLGFAAFGHLFLPNQMAQANHTSGRGNNKQFPPLSFGKYRFKPLWRRYNISMA